MTKSAFAKLVGISPQAAGKLHGAGILAEGGTGDAWLHAYCARLRAEASGRIGGDTAVARERARFLRAQAVGRERRNEVDAGTLVSAADVARAGFDCARIARDRMLRIPTRLAARFAGMTDPRAIEDLMVLELKLALTELAALANERHDT